MVLVDYTVIFDISEYFWQMTGTCTKYIYNILEKQMFQKIITKLIRIYKLYYFVGHNIWVG
jgi:hypothetical protein